MRFAFLAAPLLGLLFVVAGIAAQAPGHPRVAAPKYRTHFQVYDVQKKSLTTLFTIDGEWHAPNWTRDGKYIVSDMGGALYRIPVSGANKAKPEKIYGSEKSTITNDHALSWDGGRVAVTAITLPFPAKVRTPADISNPILVMNMGGSDAHQVHMGWMHGWSPDGNYLVYTQYHGDNYDIFRINSDGSGELPMTTNKAQDDGPEYSADGKWIYFCSNRSGKWDGWRMPAAGAGTDDQLAQRITFGKDTQDWFPHISPDGRWLYILAYPLNHPDHSYIGGDMKIKLLRLQEGVAAKGAELATVRTFFGGQGSGNTGGWAPGSRRFAWTEYEPIPDAATGSGPQ